MTASCMTEDELARWNLLNWQARLNVVHSTPCEDCTAAFSAEMRGLGLCNGFPGPQRYCVPCQRWWPEDKWRVGPRGYACLVCRQRAMAAKWYRRVRNNPVLWAARKAAKRDQMKQRYHASLSFRERLLAHRRQRYRTDPVYRERLLARNRASRARAKV